MKSTYVIVLAIVVIVIIVGSVFAYSSLSNNSNNSPTATPTVSPTGTSTPTPTATSQPTATPFGATPTPTPVATATPAPTPVPTIAPSTTLLGSGGTLVAPLMNQWVVAYNQYLSKIQVSYGGGGSGKGISDFQGGLTNFGESDAPLQASDIAGLPSGSVALTIPIAASAVVPAYKITLVNGSACQNGLNFNGQVLSGIFNGTITTWNDNKIAQLQSSDVAAQLPNEPIKVVHRAESSGTTFVFTDYLNQVSPASWTKSKTGVTTGTGYQGNGGVAAGIAATEGSIGYLEIAYELQNPSQISYGAVQNAAGNYILANIVNIQASLAAGATSLPAGDQSWASVSVIDSIYNDKTDTGIYPIITLTYALVYQSQSNYNTGAALVSFFTWVSNQGQAYSSTIGYVPLPSNIVTINTATIKLISYNGNQIPLLS